MDKARSFLRKSIEAFFFGNWFYGLCAVALSVEAALQQRQPLNGPFYHLLLFLGTAVFYTHPYRWSRNTNSHDERAAWYARNHLIIRITQSLSCSLIVLVAFVGLRHHLELFGHITLVYALLALVFPIVGLAYYGAGKLNLRRLGWSKPYVIGSVWAGVVTVYPVLFSGLVHGTPYPFTLIGTLLFVKNFMFIAMLGILFDIKDHAADSRTDLRTHVVKFGLRKTLFRFVIPLTIIGLGTFLTYGSTHDFSTMKLLLNTIPFVLLFAVAYSLRRRRSILYYLIVVDGLMLVKAACGTIAMTWF